MRYETRFCQLPVPRIARTEATLRPVRPMVSPPAMPEKARVRVDRPNSERAFSIAASKISGAVRRLVSGVSSGLLTKPLIPEWLRGLVEAPHLWQLGAVAAQV